MNNTKVCRRCGVTRETSKFYKLSSSKDGLHSYCKECQNTYNQEYDNTEQGKETRKRINHKYYWNNGGKEKQRVYDATQEQRERRKNYAKSERGKKVIRRRDEKYRLANKKKIDAHGAINNAIKRGTIPGVATLKCAECGEQATEYHHPNYDYPMHVVPLCKRCHAVTYTNPL